MDTVEITLPVTRAAADRLRREPAERARLGALVSLATEGLIGPGGIAEALAPASPAERQAELRDALTGIQRASAAAGITPEEVEAELAARKRGRTGGL
jgi:type VI protein secretion system component VasF